LAQLEQTIEITAPVKNKPIDQQQKPLLQQPAKRSEIHRN
jgi:hypothetical protein